MRVCLCVVVAAAHCAVNLFKRSMRQYHLTFTYLPHSPLQTPESEQWRRRRHRYRYIYTLDTDTTNDRGRSVARKLIMQSPGDGGNVKRYSIEMVLKREF